MVPLERYLAIDCEMVLCRSGSKLARVALVDYAGEVVYHSYVYSNPANVKDYRTETSGIRPADLEGAPTFEAVSTQVRDIVKDRILVGHALFNDLSVLGHRHVYEDCRDTALYYPLRAKMKIAYEGTYPSLKLMAREVLGKDIQRGEHSPIEDARTTMLIFLSVREEYEAALANDEDVVAGVPGSFAKWYW